MSDSYVVEQLSLPDNFSQSVIDGIKQKIDEKFADGKRIQLDVAPVESFDCAALQFIIVFANSPHSASPCMVNVSSHIVDALVDIGVDSDFAETHLCQPGVETEKAA